MGETSGNVLLLNIAATLAAAQITVRGRIGDVKPLNAVNIFLETLGVLRCAPDVTKAIEEATLARV